MAVDDPSGRNQTGSPVSSTTSGPDRLWLAGMGVCVPDAAEMSNGARKIIPGAVLAAARVTVIAGGFRSGRLR